VYDGPPANAGWSNIDQGLAEQRFDASYKLPPGSIPVLQPIQLDGRFFLLD